MPLSPYSDVTAAEVLTLICIRQNITSTIKQDPNGLKITVKKKKVDIFMKGVHTGGRGYKIPNYREGPSKGLK